MIALSKRERNAIRFSGTVRKGEADDFRAFCETHSLTIEPWTAERRGGRWLNACSGKLKAFAPPDVAAIAFERGISCGSWID